MRELTIKESQFRSYNILKFISQACLKNNLKFYLAWGTLIGAVRHDGFIPWDDDVDVFMPRDDYVKFIQFMKKNETAPFKLYSIENRNDYFFSLVRVVDAQTIIKGERKDIEKQCDCGIFVDVYPIDFYGKDKNEAELFFNRQQRCEWLKELALQDGFTYSKSSKWLSIIKYPIFRYAQKRGYKYFYNKMEDRAKNLVLVKDKAAFCCSCYGSGGMSAQSLIFPAKWFSDVLYHKFEDSVFPIPIGYDPLLRQVYGDYMTLPPEDERAGHHLYKAYALD